MKVTPSESYEHIKESLVQYLETAYKIAHPAVIAERAAILRMRSTVAQAPFIEATPSFPTRHKLVDLERLHPSIVPAGLAELVQHGVPVDRFPLYTHQEEALLTACGQQPNLLVATGTGSGKTETFLLPILADILREARNWPASDGQLQRGYYDSQYDIWIHGRRHEQRPSAIRAIVLYPMNALVNDQLSRLRRIFARGTSPDWQRRNLKGNNIYFGMYTSLTAPTGSWREEWRRSRFDGYMQRVEEDWNNLREDLRNTGGWPRPDSPEMLCRWDMQAAPPDILVTNYSMLEYMLVRPIEHPMFEATRSWLEQNNDARLTLVLDEAHTYTGAKGTEVAYLIRRLKERLGITSGSSQFRAIATSASIPNIPGADHRLRGFTADLFGEPAERFTIIRLPSDETQLHRQTTLAALHSFATFHQQFDVADPWTAIEQLAVDMQLGRVDRTVDAQVSLHRLLENNPDVQWIRQRTARRATLLDRLAEECWNNLGTPEERERATAGVLAAGSFARASELPDTPPLLSMRLHMFFRGISGLWACSNSDCPELDPVYRSHNRPIGKLYTEARPWCSPGCGGRVLELFSCRHCGLLFLGGIPDSTQGSLWPWTDDLNGEQQDLHQYRVFGVERPHPDVTPEYRSIRTTLPVHPQEVFARSVYEVDQTTDDNGSIISPFPNQCPRCQRYRAPGPEGREVIEPLRTRGPQSFAVVVEEGFRNQPRARDGIAPNYGRKAMLFSDSRQEAAILAANLRKLHTQDLFRQLVFRVLHSCSQCDGTGVVEEQLPYMIGQPLQIQRQICQRCQGTGRSPNLSPMQFTDLRQAVINLQLGRGINPTNDREPKFFTRLTEGDEVSYQLAEEAYHLALRRELSEDQFSLEPLGLASWQIALPPQIGAFPQLTEPESHLLLRTVARILATENILLPPHPFEPWKWPADLVAEYERLVIIPGYRRQGRAIPYNLQPRRKLGRYMHHIGRALVRNSRLPAHGDARWVDEMERLLWDALKGFNVLQWAGAKVADKVPYGIRIDSFMLHPIGTAVEQCSACAYVMTDALFHVCSRCGEETLSVPTQSLRSYYRLSALQALPDSSYDDPYPLRASEHTAQIASQEARNEERWFQDLFHEDQNYHDHRVDILSVTTTMEMGIDIGSLLCVGLRNVPPTVANYQQRAGRAGRRGSALATVITFAQARSHDQYYFDRPPEIVSEPPRVPALYLNNQVIAQRHVRSLILQDFFHGLSQSRTGSGLFESWGTVGDYVTNQTSDRLQQYLATNRAPLLARCRAIINVDFAPLLDSWVNALREEVQRVVIARLPRESLFEVLIGSGLLPKYAFPVDVVSLAIPSMDTNGDNGEYADADNMQRDLKIAIAEYAPGAEVIRQSFPNTYKYRSAGVYNPFEKQPDYQPTGLLVECNDCQAVDLLVVGAVVPDQCAECQSFNISVIPYLRPPGFTVDAALPRAGAVLYDGDGRERSGKATPARLLVGQTSFTHGQPRTSFAPHLYTHVRRGNLFTCNKGPDRRFPGFLICPVCGRSLDADDPGAHRYPADIPPHFGRLKGPRAGDPCPNRRDFTNQVILGHPFASEVVLLGVDLPPTLDAPFNQPAGSAVWYSFGALVANAAARILQIDPGELKSGVRAINRGAGRLHGEVFLYDDVPGGAGYARAIDDNIEEILHKALELGQTCTNPTCAGACYHCVYDYRNQALHPLLDRALGTSVLEYILHGSFPQLIRRQVDNCGSTLAEYARAHWEVLEPVTLGTHYFPCVLRGRTGETIGLWVVHPLAARPSETDRLAILAQYGVRCAVHTSFDLERRPFWVVNHLV